VPVHVLDPISPRALERLAAETAVIDWRDPAVADWHGEAEGVIVRTARVTAADLARAPRLRVIGKHGVGVDNIDIAAARARGVAVVNTPGANADAVAELTLTLALASARHVVAADRGLRAGQVGKALLSSGRELAGRRLGIAGFGQVGRRVADLFARALRCPVTAYDPGLADAVIRAAGATPVASLDALLAASDIVSLHLPLSAETRSAIGARELALMPEGAILINTARGGIVDETALAVALAQGRPAAAASDVFVIEPPPPDHPLFRLDNFIATPHLGAATVEALDRVGLVVVEEVLAVLAGRAPRYPVR
jgi:D-3-phosphoglycerate dehydrogenase